MSMHQPTALVLLAVSATLACAAAALKNDRWSADQLEELRSLWIGSLEPLPPDPTNRVADDPRAVVRPLKLSARELRQLEAYLRALSGGTAAPAELLVPPARH